MCGIAGALAAEGRSLPAAERRAAAVAALIHRGPDGEGNWSDEAAGIWFGHRRLAVVDLGAGGAQPMVSACGRCVISYNGELYNYHALREELLAVGTPLRGTSDTEVVLEVFARDGVATGLPKLNGMFALAVWDRERRELVLARDRFGEKPLYYATTAAGLVFASELDGLCALLGERPAVDPAAMSLYLRYGYVPEPRAIYAGVRKLAPGSSLTLGARDASAPADVERYWSLERVVSVPRRHFADDSQAVDSVAEVFAGAVSRRLIADVPLGVFLSGGVDSSLVAAQMQALSDSPVNTFSIGFDIPGYDESVHAAAVAGHLGTEHHALRVDASDAQAVIPELDRIYDEPIADSSQIPTVLVSRFARGAVTSVLTGDGGDEIFGGYVRYHAGLRAWSRLRRLPAALRRPLCALLAGVAPRRWDALFAALRPLLPARYGFNMPGDRLAKLGRAGMAGDFLALYRQLLAINREPLALMENAVSADDPLPALPPSIAGDAAAAMMYFDAQHYLPGDVLVKVDRAAMAASLETRAPFLDPDLVTLAWSLAPHLKIRAGGKWVLRELLRRFLPPELYERPKMGFGVPLDSWLRGGLRAWAGDLLSPTAVRRSGAFERHAVERLWTEHQSGRRNHQHVLWSVLMFESWAARSSDGLAGTKW